MPESWLPLALRALALDLFRQLAHLVLHSHQILEDMLRPVIQIHLEYLLRLPSSSQILSWYHPWFSEHVWRRRTRWKVAKDQSPTWWRSRTRVYHIHIGSLQAATAFLVDSAPRSHLWRSYWSTKYQIQSRILGLVENHACGRTCCCCWGMEDDQVSSGWQSFWYRHNDD